jgi:hypothetical protein
MKYPGRVGADEDRETGLAVLSASLSTFGSTSLQAVNSRRHWPSQCHTRVLVTLVCRLLTAVCGTGFASVILLSACSLLHEDSLIEGVDQVLPYLGILH